MNEGQLYKSMIIPYLTMELALTGTDHRSTRIKKYFSVLYMKYVERSKARKMQRRLECTRFSILVQLSKDGKEYNGHKVLLCLYFLAQMVFDNDNTSDEKYQLFKRIKFLLEYTLRGEEKDRYNNLESEKDFEKLMASAEKQAVKIYNEFFK